MAHLFCSYPVHFTKCLMLSAKWLFTLEKSLFTPAKRLFTPAKRLFTSAKWLIMEYDIDYSTSLLFFFCLRRFIHPSMNEKTTKVKSPAMMPSVILPVTGINRIVRKAGMVS